MDNIENELWVKLKDEIKTEILDELRARTVVELRDELVRSVMFKVEKLIFEERYFEKMLNTYIKTLCYKEINFLRMQSMGFTNRKPEIFDFQEDTTLENWIKNRNNIDIIDLYNECTAEGAITCSYENFCDILDFDANTKRVEWKGKSKGKSDSNFSYYGLFELYEKIYDYDFSNLNPLFKERLLFYIEEKFIFGGERKSKALIEKSFDRKYKSNA